MRPVELVMVGAGNRGHLAYGAFAERNPDLAKFVAVVEPDDARRARFANAHGIPADRQFHTWQEIAGRSPLAPALINATLEGDHRASTLALLAAGYEMLLEKPMAPTAGECLEIASAAELYVNPLHPYTLALLSAIPVPDPKIQRDRVILKGDVPTSRNPPSGCRFRTRCPIAIDECARIDPELREISPGHTAACIRVDGYESGRPVESHAPWRN